MSAAKRWAVLGSVIVAAVVAFVILQPGGGSSSRESNPAGSSAPDRTAPSATGSNRARPPETIITVVGGRPVGGRRAITVTKGERVRFTVRSDVSDEVHVHGYELMKDVPAGGSASFDFPAKTDGGFEVELEHRGEPIATLKVQP